MARKSTLRCTVGFLGQSREMKEQSFVKCQLKFCEGISEGSQVRNPMNPKKSMGMISENYSKSDKFRSHQL